ncbi:nuclear transport factor 2-like [Wolffia australiana]
MASQSPQTVSAPPQVVGNAFVQQYYHILHQSPELVHRFYQDSSNLSRPDSEGVMSTITTTQAIDAKILSLEFKDYSAEIKTVDAQDSFNGSVIVLVTGYLTGKDNIKKNFTQTFLLARQGGAYFVLNDIFRYVDSADEEDTQDTHEEHEESTVQEHVTEEVEEVGIEEATVTPSIEETEAKNEEPIVQENSREAEADEGNTKIEAVDETPKISVVTAVDPSPGAALEEAPKKSYASILKVMKENSSPPSVPSAIISARPPTVISEWQPAPAPASSPPQPESHVSEPEPEADGHSIYVKSLPLNATTAQLEEEFKRFGPIKPGGVQVRSNKQQGFCFGFVEFESAAAVQSAIEASPVTIGGRPAYVEEKRPSGSRGGSRGRYPPGRGGSFRSGDGFRGGDGVRPRGGFGGRGYVGGSGGGRQEFVSRVGGGRGYQRVDPTRAKGVAASPGVSAPA